MKETSYSALLSVTRALTDSISGLPIEDSFAAVEDWQELVEQAEIHGLSVMLGHLATREDLQIPRMLELQLKALTLRHQKVLDARRRVLQDVIDVFYQHSISSVFLKGAALSELIYKPAWLRPMRDIDILVEKNDALVAQKLLREVGFENSDFSPGYLFEHHHLPNSQRIQDGFRISLEVHHNALSGDVGASLTLNELSDQLQPIEFADRTVYAFGHRDMLKHLYHHTFEPAETIKLGSLVDMILYATHFAEQIDWLALEKLQPRTCNAFRCIDALIPLPQVLRDKLNIDPDSNWNPAGLGKGFPPLSYISSRPSSREKFILLFKPSAWWMHIYYGVKPHGSLASARLLHHPWSVSNWLWRRYRAAAQSKRHQDGTGGHA